MAETMPDESTLTLLEKQVLDRIRNGRPLGLPANREEAVLASLEAKGFGDEL